MFKHLRTKLTVLYVALFLAALGVIALSVYAATTRNVQHMVRDQLTVSGTVFDNLSATRYRRLGDEAGVLAHDFGFRAAVATGDRTTVRSALDNLSARFGVNLAFVVGVNGQVTAPEATRDGVLPASVVQSIQSGDAVSGVFVMNGVAYETVAAPINMPTPAGWVVFASPLGPDAMIGLTKLSAIPLQAELFAKSPNGAWLQLDNGKPVVAPGRLQSFINQSLLDQQARAADLTGERGGSIALVRRLPVFDGGQQVVLLMRCPMADAFKPYASLALTIAIIGLLGVALLSAGSWMLARTVTRPISALEDAARLLRGGEVAHVTIDTNDEIARLGKTFNAMADDIQQREVSLKQARDVAEAANQAKSTFLANMNHEVRTPLNGVLGVAAMLSQTGLNAHQRKMVGIIDDSGNALLRILNDVLDMVELGAGSLAVVSEPFDLAASVEGMAKAAAGDAARKALGFRLIVEADALGWVRGDQRRFEQVLVNLLSNAVKFTDAGQVTLRVTAEGDNWRFEVRDTGVGFDQSLIDELFQPFSQADGSMTRRVGGTGLGLSLAREMARAMGGDLTARGVMGKGSAFLVTLPLSSAPVPVDVHPSMAERDFSASRSDIASGQSTLVLEPAVAAAREDAAAAEATPLRVLVVDDHANNRVVIELILGALGAEIISAENGAEAVDAFKANPFDVVLMDLQMPVMDGVTAIRLIRDHEHATNLARTPIVVVSANVQSEHLKASAAAGADNHLAKPILAPTLIAAIEQALSGANAAGSQDTEVAAAS